ncbi:hypothetical protein [Neorhizobium galegae]|uniref:hypothetical protein n=1 Tax=Neorhizobium galegae TaxID=399 RepID=UPI0021034B73|nr:hypothetical protein [Neorhizobium galegae]MBY5873706.1 hypothetical protein [Rhizobium leguminosarum]MCQ1855588.1 hypothetical protein [Neorhizobium galegae]
MKKREVLFRSAIKAAVCPRADGVKIDRHGDVHILWGKSDWSYLGPKNELEYALRDLDQSWGWLDFRRTPEAVAFLRHRFSKEEFTVAEAA